MRRVCGHKIERERNEVKGGRTENYVVRSFIVWVIKSRRMIWAAHVAVVANDKTLKGQTHSRNAITVAMIILKPILREYDLRVSRFSWLVLYGQL